ncbi:MAG: hypothetical protein IIB39_00575 [Candidatus Marinimicrobia bacterium]|nr:hypothetical protein [Candidatus Neomarinimicrobiota bacterium]
MAFFFILLSCDGRDLTDGGNDNGITTQFNLSVMSDELKVTLNWDKISDDNLDLYNIYRSENEGEFILYDTVNIALNTFSDTEVTADFIYEYKITAIFDGIRESDPSEIVRIIPGFTNLWVLDFQGDVLSELTHDAAHFTGNFFDNLTLPVALDIDERNGYIYYIDGSNKTLNLVFEGSEPLLLTNAEGNAQMFSDPTDVDFDMLRDEIWLTNGNSGALFHFAMINQSQWVLSDSLNTGGDAIYGQLDIARGDYWVVNSKGKSIEIFQNRNGEFVQISATGFASGNLTLALDADRATAYVIDRSNGDIFWVKASGETTLITNIKNAFLAAVVPSTGDVWLIADDDENGIADLVKLSIVGSRILEIMNLYSQPSWIGVNPINMNVTVLNTASGEVKIDVLSNSTGENISSFKSLNFPAIARIVDKRNRI